MIQVAASRGAVLVIIEYTIEQDQNRPFLRAVRDLRRVRLRNGATRWALYRDVNRPGIWEEIYTVDSWLQHLRMLERLTVYDQQIIGRWPAFTAATSRRWSVVPSVMSGAVCDGPGGETCRAAPGARQVDDLISPCLA